MFGPIKPYLQCGKRICRVTFWCLSSHHTLSKLGQNIKKSVWFFRTFCYSFRFKTWGVKKWNSKTHTQQMNSFVDRKAHLLKAIMLLQQLTGIWRGLKSLETSNLLTLMLNYQTIAMSTLSLPMFFNIIMFIYWSYLGICHFIQQKTNLHSSLHTLIQFIFIMLGHFLKMQTVMTVLYRSSGY